MRAVANGIDPIRSNDNVIFPIGTINVLLERCSLYETMTYGNIGSNTNPGTIANPNAPWGIFKEYNRIQNLPTVNPGHQRDQQQAAIQFRLIRRIGN